MEEASEQKATSNLAVIVERLTNIQNENSKEHATIIEQVKKTNGTVADLVRWKERAYGILIMMNLFLIPIIVAACIKFVLNLF